MLDDLYFALTATKRGAERNDKYSAIVKNKIAVWEALEELRKSIEADDDDTTEPIFRRKMNDVTLVIRRRDDQGGTFNWDVESDDFATLIFFEFANLLKISGLNIYDVHRFSNETCKRPFIPLRQPREGSPAYCSNGCARIVAARNYRANKKKAKAKAKKKKRK